MHAESLPGHRQVRQQGLPGTGVDLARCLFPDSSDTGHLSRCLGSTDSSENSRKVMRALALEGSADPGRLLMANTDDRAMLTYHLPSR